MSSELIKCIMGIVKSESPENNNIDSYLRYAETLIANNANNIIDIPKACPIQGGEDLKIYPIHFATDFANYEPNPKDFVKNALTKIAIWLIEKGAKLDVECEGMLPIHYAAYNGTVEVVMAIVNKRPDLLYAKDIAEFSPLDYAEQQGHDKVSDYISTKQKSTEDAQDNLNTSQAKVVTSYWHEICLLQPTITFSPTETTNTTANPFDDNKSKVCSKINM